MAVKVKEAVAELTIDLVGPGMTYLHRAGLGGLACTLRRMEEDAKAGRLSDEELPGGPWRDGEPPWVIEPRRVTLKFGEPTAAREYLRRLFAFAFRLTESESLIDLPGTYVGHLPLPVRAELHLGLTLTILQFGPARPPVQAESVCHYDPEGEGQHLVTVQYRGIRRYKHQQGWASLTEENGTLKSDFLNTDSIIQPGAIVRHDAHKVTAIKEPPSHALASYFALVGCLALPVNGGCAVLIVPEVADVERFTCLRPAMTPRTAEECRITSAGDAALQAQARLHTLKLNFRHDLPGSLALLFRPTPWAKQQKSRVAAMHVPALDDDELVFFEAALTRLKRRLMLRPGEAGKPQEAYWIDSVVRPLVADNLAAGRKWHAGFRELCAARDDSGKSRWTRVKYESEGLNAMANDETALRDEGERVLVKSVHQAIRFGLKKIKQETVGEGEPDQITRNRWDRFKERLRLGLIGAKTQGQCRQVLCTLFGRAGAVPALQERWLAVLPMLRDDRWQAARDLALLGLASYRSKKKEGADQPQTTEGGN